LDKISISKFYEQFLSNKEFQDPETGNLFFPAYIFTYNPLDEYSIRKQIEALKDKLKRPNNFIDTLILNIFDEFISFLKEQTLGHDCLYDLIIKKESSDDSPEQAVRILKEKANSLEFFNYINQKAKDHFSTSNQFKKVYLLLHGFGSIFPFLRTSQYLKNFEQHVSGYKLIAFYPGEYEDQHYHLFNEFHDENIYRAILIR
jgi:hypothetical protein